MQKLGKLGLAILFTSTLTLGCTQNRWLSGGRCSQGNCQNGACQVTPMPNAHAQLNNPNMPQYTNMPQNANAPQTANQSLSNEFYNVQNGGQAPVSSAAPNRLPQVPPAPAPNYNGSTPPLTSLGNLGSY